MLPKPHNLTQMLVCHLAQTNECKSQDVPWTARFDNRQRFDNKILRQIKMCLGLNENCTHQGNRMNSPLSARSKLKTTTKAIGVGDNPPPKQAIAENKRN